MNIFDTVTEKFVDGLSAKVVDRIDAIKGQSDDKALEKRICALLRDKYGSEPFYNDLDAYLSSRQIISNLILSLRDPVAHKIMSQAEFVEQNWQALLEAKPNCLTYMTQIKDAFQHVHGLVRISVTDISPYSEIGHLQSDMHQSQAEMIAVLLDLRNRLPQAVAQLLRNESLLPAIKDCTHDIERFKERIKEIEETYQTKERFEEALTSYNDLSLEIAEAEISGEPKNELLCALRCNIALCYSNLCYYGKAEETLNKISSMVAANSETYHFMSAAIIVQANSQNRYEEALEHLEKAIRLKPDYYRAIFMRCQLRARLGKDSLQSIISEIDAVFQSVVEDKKSALEADYYLCKGLVYASYDEFQAAADCFSQAGEHGYNALTSRYNKLLVQYREAVKGWPQGKRTIFPNIDRHEMCAVLSNAKELLFDKRINERTGFEIKRRTLGMYLSAATVLRGSHDLRPLEDYLPYVEDKESFRMLILGSKEKVPDALIAQLDMDDQLFYEVRELAERQDYKAGREKIEAVLEIPGTVLSNAVSSLLLQICLAEQNIGAFNKYRYLKSLDLPEGDYLAAMDAAEKELEGDIEAAKGGFDQVAESAADYSILRNALRFYERNKFIQDAEKLYFKIETLQKKNDVYIEDIDGYYLAGISYFKRNKLSSIRTFFEGIPMEQLSKTAADLLKRDYAIAIRDPVRLYKTLSDADPSDFRNMINKAICCRHMRRYEEGIAVCQTILRKLNGLTEKNLSKVYWLLSDFYLFLKKPDESYSWALKAHETMEKEPYDQTHSALLGRSMRCKRYEGLAVLTEYQKIHPVVVDCIKVFHFNEKECNAVEKFHQELNTYFPDHAEAEKQNRQLELSYKKLPMPIHFLFQCFNERWEQLVDFASRCKLRIGYGQVERTELEKSMIGGDIAVDAITLVIMAVFRCLPALRAVGRIHICCSTVDKLQDYYLANDLENNNIDALFDWINSDESIVFEADGVITEEDAFTKVFSDNFCATLNVAKMRNIPYLCADSIMIKLQHHSVFPVLDGVNFVTIPSVCEVFKEQDPDFSARMLYDLLQVGSFVSFSAETILTIIKQENYNVSEELMDPFLICKSDYDMKSFANVYLNAIQVLREEHHAEAEELSRIILRNALKILRRGSFYRECLRINPNDTDARRRLHAIVDYETGLVAGIRSIWSPMPTGIESLCGELVAKVQEGLKDLHVLALEMVAARGFPALSFLI